MQNKVNDKITQTSWGTIDGQQVYLFRLTNHDGAYVEVTNYGATVVSIVVPDRVGKMDNVILGYPSLQGYVHDKCYIGSTIGRFANRIGGASFQLDGVTRTLEKNDGLNTNHGGFAGFNKKLFDYAIEDNKLQMTLFSPHGEGGFPGNLVFRVTYSWSIDNELSIAYHATSDDTTVVNFTNHAYFNLEGSGKIFDHHLTINASNILEVSDAYIPTGKIIPAGDRQFLQEKLHTKMRTDNGRVTGINTYYILDSRYNGPLCTLTSDETGRKLEVFTDYPGVQVYTGDFLNSEANIHGVSIEPFEGLCLECQFYPDSPNHDHFPSTVIRRGEVFNQKIIYRFSARS